jgi:hypothetical protein
LRKRQDPSGQQDFFELELRFAQGPVSIGHTGSGKYNELYGYIWAVAIEDGQVRLYQAVDADCNPVPVGATDGYWNLVEVVSLPHPVDEIQHIALAFDQAARPVIAYERNNEVWVHQWDSVSQQYIMRGPFPGVDPVVLNDTTVGFYQPDSDVILWHLSTDRKQLIQRVQRHLYENPQVIYSFDEPVILDQAVALPYKVQLIGSEDAMPLATGFSLQSELYPVHIDDALGQTSLSAPLSGSYIPIAIINDLGLEAIGQASLSAPSIGAYVPIVIVRDLGTDAVGMASLSAPSAGAYVPIVIVQDLGTDAVGMASLSAPSAGNYRLVVVVVDTTQPSYTSPDSIGTAVLTAPSTGAYTLA